MEPPSFEAIQSHHIPNFPARARRILELASLGASYASVGKSVGLAEESVRRELSVIREVICLPLVVEHKREASALWYGLHRECCLNATGGDQIGSGNGTE